MLMLLKSLSGPLAVAATATTDTASSTSHESNIRSVECGSAWLMRWCAFTLIMGCSFAFDAFGMALHPFTPDLGYDSYLILNRIHATVTGTVSGLAPMPGYHSQFGLQAILLGWLAKVTGIDPIVFSFGAGIGFALATAAVLAAFYASTVRYFGITAARIATLLTACTPIMCRMGPSLYWTVCLLFVPFVMTWILYPVLNQTRTGLAAFAGLLSLAVLVRCLNGYEYVTTVVLSPLPAIVFFLCRQRVAFRSWVTHTSLAVAAGLCGFGLAMVIHVIQLETFTERGWRTIVDRAKARTVDRAAPEFAQQSFLSSRGAFGVAAADSWSQRFLPENTPFLLRCFVRYFDLPGVMIPTLSNSPGTPIDLAWITGGGIVAIVGLLVAARRGHATLPLAASLMIALPASLSWQVAAINHMSVHYHLNTIVFFVPFALLVFLAFGIAFQAAIRGLRLPESTGAVLTTSFILLVAGRYASFRATEFRDTIQRANAIDAVRSHLHQQPANSVSPAAPTFHEVHAYIDGAFAVSQCLSLGEEMSRSNMMTTVHAGTRSVTLHGWAVNTGSGGTTPANIIVVCGSEIPTQHIRRTSRPDVDAIFKIPAQKSGYVVTADLPPGFLIDDIRVFAVGGASGRSVAEPERLAETRQALLSATTVR